MFPIIKNIIFRLPRHPKFWQIQIAAFAFNLYAADAARATYIVGFIGDGYAIIGADSRQEDGQGNVTSDSVCKIALANGGHVAVTLVGTKDVYWPNGTLDLFVVAVSAASEEGDALKAAQSFNTTALSYLNQIPVENRNVLLNNPRVTGIFADVTNGTAKIVFTDVIMNTSSFEFSTIAPRIHDGVGHLVPISDYGGRSLDYTTGLFHAGQKADEAAAAVKTLVDRVIGAKIAGNIGGTPTVMVLANGQRPHWYSKAADCPELE